ncbi:amidohydrolase [Lipingzhangella sp. LS1_29]|uniref:Amidohydrolase n=1 Tax=Lipingzhangella rawalii TaxID=2055835 RepID=A0ABU2HA32_9ACTN|nr:amidohydrolase [Lipingzhangella rawalii]MDS1272186.1 amidohydrolase [Lipingzhangella rawalii]
MPEVAQAERAAQLAATVLRGIDDVFPLVEGLYVDLHRNPELSHAEHRTAGAVAEWLARSGYEVHQRIGGTGVVGVLRNGPGPSVLVRADMDALPVEENTGLPYASAARGVDDNGAEVPVMHACGHDAHVASMLGAADLLAEAREHWRGTLVVVAQPAEETLDGAQAMLRDGLYDRVGRPDIVLGQHVGPQPAGMIAHRAGVILGASSVLRVRIFGSGGHGSAPHTTVDPVVLAANIVTRLQGIVAREVSPTEMAVVTVGVLQAGSRPNIIPDEANLEISVRAFDTTVAAQVDAAIERVIRGEARTAGAPREPEIRRDEGTVTTHNEPDATVGVATAHRAYFGTAHVLDLPDPLTGSEDFPQLALPDDPEPIPAVFWFIGATPHDVWEQAPGDTPAEKLRHVPSNHSPLFAPDREPTLRTGIAALTVAATTYLDPASGESTASQASARASAAEPVQPATPPGGQPVVPDPASTQAADMNALLDDGTDGTDGTGDAYAPEVPADEPGENGAAPVAPTQPPTGPSTPLPPPEGAPVAAPPPDSGEDPPYQL